MWPVAHTLCVLFSLWASGLCHTLYTVGPCVVNKEKATFDCSRQNLKSIPPLIWRNVTRLDLSENHLNIAHTKALKELQHLDHLVTLNLSGNYLPLLEKQLFYPLRSLEILDLSGCKLAVVETGALQSFPKLQKLYLGNNNLQTPVSVVLQDHGRIELRDLNDNPQSDDRSNQVEATRHRVHKQMCQERGCKGLALNMIIQNHFHRKLLAETSTDVAETTATNITASTDAQSDKKSSWELLVAVLVTAIALSILIAVVAKCKIVHKYIASYRHSRLSETDTASHCDHASFEVGFSHASSMRGNRSASAEGVDMEDDDGFIEDNYIQASERERAEREVQKWDDEDEEEDDMEFTIG